MSCQGLRVPSTYITKADTIRRRDWFIKNKFAPLITILKRYDLSYVFYEAAAFKSLLTTLAASDGVRVYLASYSAEGTTSVPSSCGGLITFVYAPVEFDDTENVFFDTGTYFILNPGAEPQTILQPLASAWVSNYQNLKLPILTAQSLLDPTDTKSILYDKLQIKEIIAEIDCQQPAGVKLYLTAYTDAEVFNVREDLFKRLTIQFVLTETAPDGGQKDFFIDDRPGFRQRPGQPQPNLDTGSPSPPASDAGSSLPA